MVGPQTPPITFLKITCAFGFSVLLSFPVSAQVESRTQTFEELRADRVARLRPLRDSWIVDIVNERVESGLLSEEGSNGFQPVVLGGTRSGNGLSYGVGYQRRDLWRERLAVRVTARATTGKAYAFDFTVELPKLLGERGFVQYYAKHENSPQMDYYGPGPDSQESDRTSYRLEDTEAELRLGYQLTRHFSVTTRLGGYFVNTGPGQRRGVPSTEDVFTPSLTPGLDEQTDYLRWGGTLRFDYRDRASAPTSGGQYVARITHYSDRELQQNGFIRLTGFAEHYFPYHNGGRVVALRFEAQTAFTDSTASQRVPFYLQPTLGGNDRLRGFDLYRFYDAAAVVAVAEHRWYVFSGLDAAAFIETGKVAPRNGLLDLNDLKWSGGLSLRFRVLDEFFMRFDNAFSSEGYRVILSFSEVFGREERW